MSIVRVVLAALLLTWLAACSAQPPSESVEAPAAAEAPAAPEPPPPAPQEQAGEPEPTLAQPPAQSAPSATDAAPTPANASPGAAGAAGGLPRVTTPVLSELMSGQARLARNGGAAVVLLSERPQDAERNLTLCRALYRTIDTATREEIVKGERMRKSVIQELRPIYVLLARTPAASGDKCAARVAAYDVERGRILRRKLGLTAPGPYLAVLNADDSRAAVIDLGANPIAQTDALVAYFKDGFSQEADIWSPQRHAPERARGALTAFFGREVPLVSLPRLVLATALCPLRDSVDACRR